MRRLVHEMPPRELIAAPEHRYVPYAEVAHAKLVRAFPVTLDVVLRSGLRTRIRYTFDTDRVGPATEELTGSLARFYTAT
jgi:hypothetical protein